jgi:predicted transcriptional regulator YheO
MKPINAEITMDHDIGISASYYKPTEREVLEDYLKAQGLLTINADKMILQKQVTELKEKSKDNEYMIRGKLQERDEEMKSMKQQLDTMQSQIQVLISSISNTKDQNQFNNMAKTLYDSGILSVPESKSQNSL